MYIAMNRFNVLRGREEAFEAMWRNRRSYLDDVPEFREFHLLRGPSNEDTTLYASHSQWDSREAFKAWTKSEAFARRLDLLNPKVVNSTYLEKIHQH